MSVSANSLTAILGVTQHCIQGEAALKASRGIVRQHYSDLQVGANCRRSKPACKVQVSLLFIEHHVVSLDMPSLCKWSEVVGVPIRTAQCSDASKKLVWLPWRAGLQFISRSNRSFPAFSCTSIQSSSNLCVALLAFARLRTFVCYCTEERGETGDQLSMKDPNLNTRENVPHSTCSAQTVSL